MTAAAAPGDTRRRALAVLATVVGAVVALTVVVGPGLSERVDYLDTGWPYHAFTLAFLVTGAVVAIARPRHRMGWLFLGLGVGAPLGGALSLLQQAGSGPGSSWWITGGEAIGTATIVLFVHLILLTFPTGRLLSSRWGWAVALVVLTTVAGTVASLLRGGWGGDSEGAAAPSPVGVAGGLGDLLSEGFFLLFPFTFLAAAVSVILRYRRSLGEERVQLRWLAAAGSAVIVVVPVMLLGPVVAGPTGSVSSLLAEWIVVAAFCLVPLAAGIAVLRYRLYDIDIVINKTLVFVALAAFITAVYAAIVVGLGRLLPIADGNLALSVAATAVVAVAFEPVRARVQHAANRLVYGRRATPYEALAAMTARLGDIADPDAGLAEAARLLAEGTGAAATVWVTRDGCLVPAAATGGPAPDPVPLDGDEPPGLAGADLVAPVRDGGRLVGALSLAKRPGEGVSVADRKLVRELAGQATLLLANTRLRARLRERLDELRASRRRLLAAQDLARHALERDLHDGAQQDVVACKIKLGLARTIATREGAPELAERLGPAAQTADRAVDSLREVARGIYPPLLESEGLAAALGAQARRAEVDVTVIDRGAARYPRDVEVTAYFCAVEAVQNTVRHAHATHVHLELDGTGTAFTLTATDDGVGFDTDRTPRGAGLTHMLDRADAAGGTLVLASRPAHGTTITLPL